VNGSDDQRPRLGRVDCLVSREGLERGDVGTVVHVYADGQAFEVEFTALDGETAPVVTVGALQVRPVGPREISHAREMAAP
jgi:hypothetical protein